MSNKRTTVICTVAGFITGIACTLPAMYLLKDEVRYLNELNERVQSSSNDEYAKHEYQLRMNNLKIDILTQEVKCLKTYPERIDYEKGIVFPCVVPSTHDDNMQELELMHRFPKQFLDEILDEMNGK